MFYIFSGPLFANLQSYVYLDLLIWGVAPLIFLIIQPYIKKMILKSKNKLIRLFFLILLTFIVWIAYLFMNYSQGFNWNYFSRIFNLDLGFFMFDLAGRIMTYIIVLQDKQDQIISNNNNNKNNKNLSIFDIKKQCKSFCHIKYVMIALSYGLVFWFSLSFNVNQRQSGQKVLSICSFISSMVTLIIPVSYYFKHQKNFEGYNELKNQIPEQQIEQSERQNYANQQSFLDQQINQEKSQKLNLYINKNNINKPQNKLNNQDQLSLSPASSFLTSTKSLKNNINNNLQQISNKKISQKQSSFLFQFLHKKSKLKTIGMVLLQGSLFINLNYFSLWIMQSLKNQSQYYVQYNLTIIITSTFFLLSTLVYYLIGHTKILQQQQQQQNLRKIAFMKIPSILYGIYLCSLYFISYLSYYLYFGIIIIGYQQILTIKKLQKFIHIKAYSQNSSLITEIIVFLIIPIIFQIGNIGQQSLLIYAFLSGIMCLIGTLMV